MSHPSMDSNTNRLAVKPEGEYLVLLRRPARLFVEMHIALAATLVPLSVIPTTMSIYPNVDIIAPNLIAITLIHGLNR